MDVNRRCAVVLALVLTESAKAENLFGVDAHTTSGTPQSIKVNGNNLPDLVTHLVKNEQQFAGLDNRDVAAVVRYAGIKNAITIQKNAANTSATVRIPSIGLTKTFTASDANGLKDQIIDYVKKNGASEYAKFLREVNQTSTAGVTDGNPLAATAMLADHQYFTFGLEPAPFPPAGRPDRLDTVSTPRFRFDVSGGVANTTEGNGYFVSGGLDVGFRFTDNVGLVFSTPFLYRSLEGASIYEIGEQVALPIALVPIKGDRGFSWTVTPAGIVGAAGSLELAAGGTFAGGGITSSASYRIDTFTLTLADHYSYYRGYPIHVGDYNFDTDLEQQVLKNGLKLTKTFGRGVILDAGITYTNFLERSAIRDYWTPSAGIGFRFSPAAGLRIGYAADLASGFTVHQGNVQLYVNY